jgi:apolipoprotein N-acyltransferase
VPVALLQPGIPQLEHWDPQRIPSNIERHLELSKEALSERPHLLIWPEAAATFDVRADRRFIPQLLPAMAAGPTYFLVGTPYVEVGPSGRSLFNAALLFDPFGRIVGRYDKRELLPFGEYYPAWIKAVGPLYESLKEKMGSIEIQPGRPRDRMRTDRVELATLVCHEILFPSLVRQSIGEETGLLVNISNDAWFGTSGAIRQHFQLAVLRSVENRIPLVRAANFGVTASVDSAGRVSFADAAGDQGWGVTRVIPATGKSFYGRFGDLFAILCSIGVCLQLIVLAWSAIARRKASS